MDYFVSYGQNTDPSAIKNRFERDWWQIFDPNIGGIWTALVNAKLESPTHPRKVQASTRTLRKRPHSRFGGSPDQGSASTPRESFKERVPLNTLKPEACVVTMI